MILQEVDEAIQRQLAAAFAPHRAVAVSRGLPLVTEAFGQAASQMPRGIVRVIPVVAVGLARDENMRCMVKIVVPLSVEQVW